MCLLIKYIFNKPALINQNRDNKQGDEGAETSTPALVRSDKGVHQESTEQ